MTELLTPFEELASLYSEAFGILAGMTDNAIKRTVSERQATREGRRNPALFHAGIREAVLMDIEGLAALEEHGISIVGGVSDSLLVRVPGRTGGISVTHRPTRLYAEDLSLGDGLFPANSGRPCFFYSDSFAGLRKFTMVETATPKDDFFLYGVQVIDEIEIMPIAVTKSAPADPATSNDHDNLDDLFSEQGEIEKPEQNDTNDDNAGDAAAS